MKNSKCIITAPLLVTVILLLIPISEKLLTLTAVNDGDLLLTAGAVQLFIFAIPTAFYCKIKGVEFFEFSKVKHVRLSEIPFTVASAFTCFFAAIILTYLQIKLFPVEKASEIVRTTAESNPLGVLLTYVIIPAFSEEFFFRSVLISDYSEFKGPSVVIMSAVYFAMLHFSFHQLLTYFLIGMILATVTYVTNSSFPSMIIHLIYNAMVVFMGDGLSEFLSESSASVILGFLLTVAFMISLATMLSTMENVYESRSEQFAERKLPGSRRAAVNEMSKAGKVEKREEKTAPGAIHMILSPTFILCVLTFILITVSGR